MASKLLTKISLHHTESSEVNPLTLSDDQILEQIYGTHVHSDEKFDVDSLFIVVDNILDRSTHIVDSIVQGTQANIDHSDEKLPKPSFVSPFCTLKQVACQMTCKAPGEEIAHKTTLAILNKLSSYSWDAKAVLTLGAFALDYGEFWLLAQTNQVNHLAKSIGVLRGVPVITKPAGLQKHRQAITELNNVIKATLQVIETIFELEKLSHYDTKDVPALASSMDQIPVDAYWAIITVVACATQINCLIRDGQHTQELSRFGQKLNIIISKLRNQLKVCNLQIEEAEYQRKLRKLFQTPTEILEVFKVLIFWKGDKQPLYDGSTKTSVDIEVLRKKHVLMFFSGLDITDEEISILKPIHEALKRDNQYKIVWIPMVEQWTEELRKRYEILKARMTWYVVPNFSNVAAIKFIKEEWHFKGKPIIVVTNPQGKVQHPNAMHMIKLWGIRGFPFTTTVEETLSRELHWVSSVAHQVHPNVATWIKEDKYIFFYGGKDSDWAQNFAKYANGLANDAILKEAKIYIELVHVGKNTKGEHDHNILANFWSSIESLFITKAHKHLDPVTQEVQKLLSYKNESGWALLSKGSTVVISGHGTTFLKTLEEFGKWRELVSKKGFEIALKEHHEKVLHSCRPCSHLEIANVVGKIPEFIKCPECYRKMDTFISFKCCHTGGTANGPH
ncbi:Protein SIEVE ELEMENT OCCLUSION B [Quillaja saponaria]|uniref:Protein SIEVE ELEMENT OCCLUSION B n=1 Tax=Quillaja saponaria TaxID=32244 RepID=A0AAD7QEA1_QUISA|nr:Protein SIEVE ELEMENT OCCLUSION B [Quillaja saponaria]